MRALQRPLMWEVMLGGRMQLPPPLFLGATAGGAARGSEGALHKVPREVLHKQVHEDLLLERAGVLHIKVPTSKERRTLEFL